ncbi:sestrin-1-like isoform X8 [Tachypleus tridentatus]|uniref:sestrin-1-like isoform X8 n=1 Tax=Tachypleus tridentatus TaxID=6853 RepID=UPI003FD63300
MGQIGDKTISHSLAYLNNVRLINYRLPCVLSTQALFADTFLQNNKLDHVTQVMGYHPQYLDPFLRTQNYILKGDGPLPFDYRHYIAIMASSRHQCTYLVKLQIQEFLLQEGNKEWLNGLCQVPQKLRDLDELNKILAHQPWLFNKSHIEAVDAEAGVELLMLKMKTISEQQEESTQEEKLKCFQKEQNQSAELITDVGMSLPRSDIQRFTSDPDFSYRDFARRREASEIPTFRIQDYSWEDHGYSLLNRLYNDAGTFLDEKFKTAYDMTYHTMGSKNNVDTSTFRRAIWNYIQCLYGIRHDDYDYKEVNELLEKNLKTCIKTLCCYPERTTKDDYDNVMREFRHSEKVHVNIMMLEARMQAELLYALRAIMRYMT